MPRRPATPNARRAIAAVLQTGAVFLMTAFTPSPIAAQVAKVQKLPDTYRTDPRLVAVVATGAGDRRCIGATVGHFAVLTSYECLADWWTNTAAHQVRLATDVERKYAVERFARAWRGGPRDHWAVLETYGHSSGYYGYENLERTSATDVFDFIGFSSKVKGGKQPAIQPRCRLTRVSAGVYTSECGADFGSSAILLLRQTGTVRYVSGLAWVRSEAKVDKRRLFTIETASMDAYWSRLIELRRDQDSRYAAVMRERQAIMAQQQAANAEFEAADQAARAARAERRRADLDKFGAALGQLAATLAARGRTTPPPVTSALSPTRWSPTTPAATSADSCSVKLSGPTLYSGTMAVAPSAGGDVVVNVVTGPGCPWRFATEGQSGGAWITSTSRLEGAGPATLRFSATPHPPAEALRGLTFRVVVAPRPGQPAGDRDFRFRITQCTPDIPLMSCGAGAATSQ